MASPGGHPGALCVGFLPGIETSIAVIDLAVPEQDETRPNEGNSRALHHKQAPGRPGQLAGPPGSTGIEFGLGSGGSITDVISHVMYSWAWSGMVREL